MTATTDNTYRFYFLRHGQSVANATNIRAGTMDSPLTERGRADALAARAAFMALARRPDRIITSHLQRAKETAAIVNQFAQLPVTEHDGLHEQFYGEAQGVDLDIITRTYGPYWIENPPGGENFESFRQRIHNALADIFNEPDNRLILIVGHGGMAEALAGPYSSTPYDLPNCGLIYYEGARDGTRLTWTRQSALL